MDFVVLFHCISRILLSIKIYFMKYELFNVDSDLVFDHAFLSLCLFSSAPQSLRAVPQSECLTL